MRELFLAVIRRGGYDLNTMLRRIDEYHVEAKLTDEERVELIAAARGDAEPGMNLASEVQKLWSEVKALKEALAHLCGSGDADTGAGADDVPEYHQPSGAHDAYYNGNVMRWIDGKAYTCVAPIGVACVWGPDVMPGYWQVMDDA